MTTFDSSAFADAVVHAAAAAAASDDDCDCDCWSGWARRETKWSTRLWRTWTSPSCRSMTNEIAAAVAAALNAMNAAAAAAARDD